MYFSSLCSNLIHDTDKLTYRLNNSWLSQPPLSKLRRPDRKWLLPRHTGHQRHLVSRNP